MKNNYTTPRINYSKVLLYLIILLTFSFGFSQGDTPCTAVSLGYTTSCTITTGNNTGFTNSGVPAPTGCAPTIGYNGADAWYTAQTGAGGDLMVQVYDDSTAGNTLGDSVFAIYTGTCSSLTLFDCDDDGGIGLESGEYFTGLPPNSTVYIRVWDFAGGQEGIFSLCAYDPVPNPNYNCAGAIALPCPTTGLTATTKYTQSDPHGTGCTMNDVGVWYTFTGDGDYYTIDLVPETGYNMEMAIMSGSCGSLTNIACVDNNIGTETYAFTTGVGVDYYIYVGANFTSPNIGDFTISLSCMPVTPPPNDDCANATLLNCGDSLIQETTIFSTPTAHGTTCSISNEGVWYTFNGNGDYYTIEIDPDAGFNAQMAILQGNTCGGLTTLNCINNAGTGGFESYSFVTSPATRYYIYVAGVFGTGRFDISLSCTPATPPPNDDCSGAIELVINASCVPTQGTTLFASTSTAPAPGCGGTIGSDVWYSVTIPPNAGNSVTITTVEDVIDNSVIAAYSNNCGSLNLLACNANGGAGNMSQLTINNALHGVVAGDVIYIRVWENGNDNNGTFGICATATVSATVGVTICEGSPSEPLQTDAFCNTAGIVPDSPNFTGEIEVTDPIADRLDTFIVSTDPCAFDPAPRYYEEIDFTVNISGTYVFSINCNFDSMGYIVVNDGNFVPGSCATGTYIAGDDATLTNQGPPYHSQITANLFAGVNYTLITTHWPSFIPSNGNYSWDVNINATSAEWFTSSVGGSPVGYGAYFDPIGVSAVTSSGAPYSNLTDTNTPGTYSFWVACPGDVTRTQVDYVITPRPVAVITGGSPGAGCSSYNVDISYADTDSTATVWLFFGTTDGGATNFFMGNATTANGGSVTLSVSTANASNGDTLEIFGVNSNGSAGGSCTWDTIGSVTVSFNSKTWTGAVDSDWFGSINNWSPPGFPTSSDCVTIPDVSGASGNDPFILGTDDADSASIYVESGGLLTINPTATLTVQNEVTVAAGGTFELQGSQQDTAQLIQVNNVSNSGNITMVRETNVRSQDYVYWSSPVANFAVTSIAPSTPVWLIFDWIPTVSGNPGQHGEWNNTTENMIAGKGYIVRGPANAPGTNDTNPTWNTANFTGVPHNGTITRDIARGGYGGTPINGGGGEQITNEDDNWNLIGNPYPSSLDAVDFLTTNSNIEGTVYLWTHGTRIQQGNGSPFYGTYVYNYNISDYLEYNISGGVQSGFNGYIGSGQGFFIKMLNDTDTTPATSTVTFDNTMRDRTQGNNQFFRTVNPIDYRNIERHRIWLDLVEPSGNTNSTLLAYVQGATMEKDRLFDAKTIGGNGKNLYTVLNDVPLIIQGRSLPFDITDEVPLGINVTETGVFAIAIQKLDGLFEDTPQDIFIHDIETGIVHNLKEAPYFFTLNEVGEYNNRFIVQYTNNALNIDEFETNDFVISAPGSNYIKVKSRNQAIDSIVIYDLHGRILIDKRDINAQEFIINQVPQSTGTYLVKAILTDGSQKVQKIILK